MSSVIENSSEPSGSPDQRTHKQVIVIRKDLGMRKGKFVAQGAHASWAAVLSRAVRTDAGWMIPNDQDIGPWLAGRFAKITVGVNSEDELVAIYQAAELAGLPCAIIRDAGLTEFKNQPTLTAVAVGPGESAAIDLITSKLGLL